MSQTSRALENIVALLAANKSQQIQIDGMQQALNSAQNSIALISSECVSWKQYEALVRTVNDLTRELKKTNTCKECGK